MYKCWYYILYIIGSKLGIRLQLHIQIQMHTHINTHTPTHTHIVSQEIYLSNNTNFFKNIILSFFCCVYNFGLNLVSLVQNIKNLPAMWDTWVWSLSQDDPLEEGMATHCRILAWKIPMDRGAWRATVYGVTKSRTGLSISKLMQMLEFSWVYAFWNQLYWSERMCNYMLPCGGHSSVCFDRGTPFSQSPQCRYKIPPPLPKISFSSQLNVYPLSHR